MTIKANESIVNEDGSIRAEDPHVRAKFAAALIMELKEEKEQLSEQILRAQVRQAKVNIEIESLENANTDDEGLLKSEIQILEQRVAAIRQQQMVQQEIPFPEQ
mgnify:CR=1 FL=1|tara:strand:+ start:5252 stop:5563 length:312 start_codon:yes stop_codon:yes gene_type:complete